MKITFDLEELLDKVVQAASEGPTIFEQASGLGFAVPPGAQKYLGMAGIGAQMLRKFVPSGDNTGLDGKGMPNTGPAGRGRLTYLRNKAKYSDQDVVAALNRILSPENNLPAAKGIDATVSFTLSIMFPGSVDSKSDNQVRLAVDQILELDGLEQGMCDKFGDLINYCLTTIEAKK